MTTTTILARNGDSLSYDVQINGWYVYINGGGYTDEQQATLAGALMDAQREEFNSWLPAGCIWYPRTSEVIGPVGVSLSNDLDDAMRTVCEWVTARFDEIEREALSQ